MFKLALLAVLASLLALAPLASSASTSTVVVAEVFAGGGNSGAPYANDYVELFNRGSAAVDVTGWTVQYAASASTSWSATSLSGTIPAGGRYLVALASGGSVGAALPAADATGTTNLAATGGKVALVDQATALTCGATAGSCGAQASVRDLVGYGTATDFEGTAAAPALSATTAAARAGGGCTDTDDNAADFAAVAPAPANSTSTAAVCGGATSSGTSSSTVNVDLDLQSAISLSLDRATVGFGTVAPGTVPPPATVVATVVSSDAAGYSLTVHRTPFAPADLPLAIARTGGALVPLPIASELQLATTTAPSAGAGDAWSTSLGFVSPLPLVAAGHYSATVTYTVVGK